jgi:hypothetical protein
MGLSSSAISLSQKKDNPNAFHIDCLSLLNYDHQVLVNKAKASVSVAKPNTLADAFNVGGLA